MKDRTLFLAVTGIVLALLAGCASSPPAPAAPSAAPMTPVAPMAPHAAHGAPAANEAVSPSFTVSGAVGRRATFDLAALQAMPAVTQTAGGNSYTGVSLWSLLNDASVGLKPDTAARNPVLSMYAVVVGSDSYRAVVSLAEIAPESGNRVALVAYSLNGMPLGRNGMARLVMAGDVKPGRSVARLAAIEVFAAQPSGR
ncbi:MULTISPECIES: molybdopterin-dependent oxidoreductase [unclassified Variovorax]|uniref:molybdopterin-dependent oxidoreductase n=1 Tax=unclassified Variovorax TaxID=663243 RepID=UPI0008CB90DC|nr:MULTISPECIES: molybdopterin-dependent oxidoreductase [unclassified Variovorax]SEJ59590.1 DMSO/TMAO reductase YedYZ, molybdopterin-dependent catalytic subunit [Variovorax sp. OK202]SFC65383.1 DMSO/TMAO reductase YedYZ, molybdopterin-dependent catalytic subunit [Variovorax sp. OK212]